MAEVAFSLISVFGGMPFLAGGGLVAASPALWRRRGGWLGIPAGALVSIASIIFAMGIDERLLILYWAGVPAFMASRLPWIDSLFAIPIGLAVAIAFFFYLPNGGPDSPVNGIVAFCAFGFALGALIPAVKGGWNLWERKEARSHG